MSAQTPDKTSKRLEIAAAIILSLASLLTAWSTYQAAQWSRTQATRSNGAVTKLVEGTQLYTLAGQDTLVDVITFTNWLEAVSTDNQALEDFYRSRFRAEFRPVFEAWIDLKPLQNPAAPSSPFAMAEYKPANRQEAVNRQVEAGELQKEARSAAENAELYVRNTLFLASALFFVGMSRLFYINKVRLMLEVVAAILLLLGALNALRLPIA